MLPRLRAPRVLRLPPALETPLGRLDELGDRALDALRGHAVLDRVFYTASALADHSLLWHAIGAVRALQGERQLKEAVRLSAALGAESAIVNLGVKSLFRRGRPVHLTARPFHLRTPRTSSFPSGHASAAFCAATILTDTSPGLAPAWFGLAAVVALSRPYVRIHHVSDVVVGAAVGTAIGLATVKLVPLRARAEAADQP